MFIVKFYKHNEESEALESSTCHAVSCGSYVHYQQGSSETVTCYPKMTTENGVEFHVNDSHNLAFDMCYVENQAGKTIASFGRTVNG